VVPDSPGGESPDGVRGPVPAGAQPSVRVAFLSLTHPFDDTRILHKEARALAEAGYDVVHIAPDDGRGAPERLHGVRIALHSTGPHAGRLGRVIRLWRRAWVERAGVLHANEVESWLVALLVKAGRPRTRVVFDVHEHFPSRFAEPRFPRWLRWVGEPGIRLLFRLLTPVTDHLIFAKHSVAPDFRVGPDRHTFVFNYAPRAAGAPMRAEIDPRIRAEFGPHPVAVHLGGWSRARGWPQLLVALSLMRHRDLRVVAFGEIEEGASVFWAEAERLGVRDRIDLRSRVTYDELFEYLAAADVGLMLYQPGILNHVYAFPMKLYDYMRAGLPSIGPRFAVEVAPVIEQERCGWLIDTGDPAELATVLDEVCENRAAARDAGRRGHDAVMRSYHWEAQAVRLVRVYERLVRGSTSTTTDTSVGPSTDVSSTSTSAGRSEP
jgi:glycosyltransferase involved in cell wall biosynthesis